MFVNTSAPKFSKNDAFYIDKYQSDEYNIDIDKFEVLKWTRVRS